MIDELKKPTLNAMGYANAERNPALDAFLTYVEKTQGVFADIGAAYGYATIEALKRGGNVWAIDLEKRHLDELRHNVPEDLQSKLICKVGHFPKEVELPQSAFDGILMSKVLLFFGADEIDAVFCAVHASLKVGGCFYVTSPSPLRKSLEIYRSQYDTQKKRGDVWPGRVFDYTMKFPIQKGQLPDELQFIDQESLSLGLSRSGFKVSESGYWPLNDQQRREAFDVVYAIAVKTEAQ